MDKIEITEKLIIVSTSKILELACREIHKAPHYPNLWKKRSLLQTKKWCATRVLHLSSTYQKVMRQNSVNVTLQLIPVFFRHLKHTFICHLLRSLLFHECARTLTPSFLCVLSARKNSSLIPPLPSVNVQAPYLGSSTPLSASGFRGRALGGLSWRKGTGNAGSSFARLGPVVCKHVGFPPFALLFVININIPFVSNFVCSIYLSYPFPVICV